MKILICGPYFTNYSLAKVNRGLAVALAKANPDWDVKVWKNPTFDIDYLPKDSKLDKYPDLKPLLSNDIENTDVMIYCGFPSSAELPYGFSEMPGKLKLAYQFWEETVFPADKVAEINKDALFKPYKDLSAKIAEVVSEYNPAYKYPKSLSTTLIETSHSQQYFSVNLPRLTDATPKNRAEFTNSFLEDFLFKAIA